MAFDTYLQAPSRAPGRWRRGAVALSLLVHVGLVVCGLVVSIWSIEELTPKALGIVFAPVVGAPPPAPLVQRGSVTPKRPPRTPPKRTAVVPPEALVQPTPEEAPDEEAPGDPKGADDGADRGSLDGIKDGIPDGTGGGGGGGDRIEHPPVAPEVRLPPNVARGQLAIDPQADAHRVKLPPALARAGASFWALVSVCAGRDGRVERVNLVKGADPTLDPLILAALATWRYRPWSVDGRAVPFCTMVRYEISAR